MLAAQFHADTSIQDFTADLVVILVMAINIALGLRHGILRRAVALVGVFGGTALATSAGNALAGLLGISNRLYGNAWCFLAIFLAVVIMFETLGALYSDQLEGLMVITFDRVVGAVAGVVLGFAQVGIIYLVALAVGDVAPAPSNTVPANHAAAATAIRESTLGSIIVDLQPGVRGLFSPALPGNMADHLAEGTAAPQQ